MSRIKIKLAGYLLVWFHILPAGAQNFKHPGIDQSADDLRFTRQMINEGKQPWLKAFQNLEAEISKEADLTASAHVKRGPYGKPNIGANQLSKGADRAYQWALYYYLTDNELYARKATELLMAWSDSLQDFDFNDAKLLAAWTGHKMCNAAEILRYHYPQWTNDNTQRFSKMLMTVHYPLIRYYFPEANGNWDGAIIHTLMAIGIFTDNRPIFDDAVDHFLYGPVNGSLFKYIYPTGQCQETMRDQGHVQLGLGEFAGAAHIAYTQGVDLFSIAGNRLALGYEYTASFLNGSKPLSYGPISPRAIKVRDDYEHVTRHYEAQGIKLPESSRLLDSTRINASLSVLSATRAPKAIAKNTISTKVLSPFEGLAGASEKTALPKDAIQVKPGESLQEAINKVAGSGKWIVAMRGVHTLPQSLVLPSDITLAGEGKETILFLDPKSGNRDAIINEDASLKNVVIRDLVIEAGPQTEVHSDPNSVRSFRSSGNRGGILFQTAGSGKIRNITMERVTIKGATYNGAFLNGIDGLKIISCDFNECGSRAVPGPRIQHNLLLTHCQNVVIEKSRFATSPFGAGLAFKSCNEVSLTDSELVRNATHGLLITESQNVTVSRNFIEGNDLSGVMIEYLWSGSDLIKLEANTIHYNGGYGIESYACGQLTQKNNLLVQNRERAQFLISKEKTLVRKRSKP